MKFLQRVLGSSAGMRDRQRQNPRTVWGLKSNLAFLWSNPAEQTVVAMCIINTEENKCLPVWALNKHKVLSPKCQKDESSTVYSLDQAIHTSLVWFPGSEPSVH